MEKFDKKIPRRYFNKIITGSLLVPSVLQTTGVFGFLSKLIGGSSSTVGDRNVANQNNRARTVSQNPISKLNQLSSTAEFTGDEPDPNHERLWNVDGYIQKAGGIPAPSETQNLVIIGGGLSGLISGYYMQSLKPLILEQASQFGGNSKGEAIGTSIYSLGPAYISIPEANSASAKMLNQIGAIKYAKLEKPQDKAVFLKEKYQPHFWLGNQENSQVYQQWLKLLKNFEAGSSRNISVLNKITMSLWIKNNFPQITPALYEYLEYYSWSSFGATLEEVAAGEFLSWQASEQHGVMVFAGGNSLITESLYEFLKNKVGVNQLRTKATVLKVIPGNGFVDIVVEESLFKLKTIRAKYAIMAAPKFVAKKIIATIPANQLRAMEQITYRSYMVGNVTLKKNITSKGFDLYCLNGRIPERPTPSKTMSQGFTDMIFANWAQNDKASPATITMYKAFPYQGARQFLLNPMAHNKHRDFMLIELKKYFPELGISADDIAAVRMTLWGHAVPVCQAGFASSKELELASQPIGNIFFANQDNSISPSYESAESAALAASLEISKRIRSGG